MKKFIVILVLLCSVMAFGTSIYPLPTVGDINTWGTDLNNYLNAVKVGVNIKEYGATGDGVTDDTTAIQDAIDSLTNGGIVFMPPGAFKITAPIILTSAHGDAPITFMGSGTGRLGVETSHTTRILNSANTDAIVFRSLGGVIIENLTIEDTFTGTRTAGAGILGSRSVVDGGVSAHIRDVQIQGHQDGVRIVRGQQTIVENVVAIDAVRDGFRLEDAASGGGTSVTFRNCFANESGNDGFSQRGYSYCLYENCASDNATNHGYFLDSDNTSVVSTTYLSCGSEGATLDGFFLDIATDVSLLGCFASGSGDDGLSSSVNGLTVIGSKFTANTGYGINIVGNQNIVITNCQNTSNSAGQFNDATNKAIIVNGSTDNAIRIGAACRIIQGVSTLANDATPSVTNGNQWATGGTTTITDFDDGITGMVIIVLANHPITITDGTNILLNGSIDFDMTASDTLTLIQKSDGKWYETGRGDNGA